MSSIVISQPSASAELCTANCQDDPDSTAYGPAGATRIASPIDACEVHSSKVFLAFNLRRAHGRGRNYCKPLPQLEATELSESIHKLNAHGYWALKASDWKVHNGPGEFDVRVGKHCATNSRSYWRGTAMAYTVVNGVGYVGSNRKYGFQDFGA